MTQTEIAKAFSNGAFENTYDAISEKAVWTIVEEACFEGKQAIMENCRQVAGYFKTVTTDFQTLDVISDKNKVVVNGTAEFSRGGKRISFVSACDIYEFDDDDKIRRITSYCIQAK